MPSHDKLSATAFDALNKEIIKQAPEGDRLRSALARIERLDPNKPLEREDAMRVSGPLSNNPPQPPTHLRRSSPSNGARRAATPRERLTSFGACSGGWWRIWSKSHSSGKGYTNQSPPPSSTRSTALARAGSPKARRRGSKRSPAALSCQSRTGRRRNNDFGAMEAIGQLAGERRRSARYDGLTRRERLRDGDDEDAPARLKAMSRSCRRARIQSTVTTA